MHSILAHLWLQVRCKSISLALQREAHSPFLSPMAHGVSQGWRRCTATETRRRRGQGCRKQKVHCETHTAATTCGCCKGVGG